MHLTTLLTKLVLFTNGYYYSKFCFYQAVWRWRLSAAQLETYVWKLTSAEGTTYIRIIFVNDKTRTVFETCLKTPIGPGSFIFILSVLIVDRHWTNFLI